MIDNTEDRQQCPHCGCSIFKWIGRQEEIGSVMATQDGTKSLCSEKTGDVKPVRSGLRCTDCGADLAKADLAGPADLDHETPD